MAKQEWATRFLEPIGVRASLRIYWGGTAEYVDGKEPADPCPNAYGKGHPGIHNAQVHLLDSPVLNDWEVGGSIAEYAEERWPTKCDHCGKVAPPQTVLRRCCTHKDCTAMRPVVMRQIFRRTLYQTQVGDKMVVRDEMEPGDMYYADWFSCVPEPGGCHHGWSNCDGKHLIVILPSPHHHPWDVDGRASNCTLKDDTTHRCWVRHGDPRTEAVHVDKAVPGHLSGTTCSAGAGSIQADGWHGFLHHGKITL